MALQEQAAWDATKEMIGRAAHEAWRSLPPRTGHPDDLPWDDLPAGGRAAVVDAVAGRERFRLAFVAGWSMRNNATILKCGFLVERVLGPLAGVEPAD
jgi:hypothetical protein